MKEIIKNIIFDFGGVLINLDRNRCLENFRLAGVENMEDLIDPFEQQGIFMQLEKGLITASEFREEIKKESSQPISDQQIDNAWNSFLVDIPAYKLDALLTLRNRYNIYLLSNTNQIHWEWSLINAFPYKGFTATDYFNEIFLSYKLHKTKPGTGIFQTVLNETGILPGETFFIDDSPANCETAQILGIDCYTPRQSEDWCHLFNEYL